MQNDFTIQEQTSGLERFTFLNVILMFSSKAVVTLDILEC